MHILEYGQFGTNRGDTSLPVIMFVQEERSLQSQLFSRTKYVSNQSACHAIYLYTLQSCTWLLLEPESMIHNEFILLKILNCISFVIQGKSHRLQRLEPSSVFEAFTVLPLFGGQVAALKPFLTLGFCHLTLSFFAQELKGLSISYLISSKLRKSKISMMIY